MSKPISSYLARKISGSIKDTIDKSKYRNIIYYTILMSFGLLLIGIVIYRLMYYPYTTENHIASFIAFILGLLLCMVTILHRRMTKKDVWDNYRNNKIKR